MAQHAKSPKPPHHNAANHSRRTKLWTRLILGVTGVLSIAVVVLVVEAFLVKTPTSNSSSPTTTGVSTGSGPNCPLTGAPAPSGAVPNRPALAIKVDNYPAARPQAALDKADIVVEEPVEGGITRFVAIFQCQGAVSVGPIRSARAIDAQILDQFSDPIFVHAGGIAPVISLIRQSNITDENFPNVVTYPYGRVAPYDTYISTANGWGLAPKDTSPPNPLFSYDPTVPNGSAATDVHIPFSFASDETWQYQSASGQYALSYSGVPATLSDGKQISASNVVVQQVVVTYGPWQENSQGALEVQAKLTGSGPLEVFRNGVEVQGTWQRSSTSQPTQLLGPGGTAIPLQPGNTWIDLVPSAIPVTTSNG